MTPQDTTASQGPEPGYAEQLGRSADRSGSVLCLGIDPLMEYLPDEFSGTVADRIAAYVTEVLELAKMREAVPAAFKPNIGYFHALDEPRAGRFEGSAALARILDTIRAEFPGVPVILDAKRGDIARSSANYGQEAFDGWGVDAMTASPYMGYDSVAALLEPAARVGGLVYVLAVTSNPGAHEFQALSVEGGGSVVSRVSQAIAGWHRETGCCGAVVGATHPDQRDELLGRFAPDRVPVLIPGVGAQGGRAGDVMNSIRTSGYPRERARVNVSSGITHPWRDAGAPGNWRAVVGDALSTFHGALG